VVRPKSDDPRTEVANVRLTPDERDEMEALAEQLGFSTISEYVRHLHRNCAAEAQNGAVPQTQTLYKRPSIFHRTVHGTIYLGDSLGLLHATLEPKSVDLIMTSPPFGLVRKKSYGNEDAERYLNWFRPFAEGFRRVLKDSGSLVVDIGGAWKPGTPTRSLYHFELLIMLCEEYGFHLCQEHYWWNPAKLPTPAEWVNVRRIRVKDAVNTIWWLSTTPWPKANNRRILAPYSASMHDLLKNGYKAKLRPSGHDISEKFRRDNGGAVPPNLLALANTESNGRYQDYCHEKGLPVHPARYPATIPEYFIRFLTDAGDTVLDPFAGSCVTGEAAERIQRNWLACELSEEYLKGALARFPVKAQNGQRFQAKNGGSAQVEPTYGMFAPCLVPVADADAPLQIDGGKTRPAHLRGIKPVPRSKKR
jgi:DNA modification methylase